MNWSQTNFSGNEFVTVGPGMAKEPLRLAMVLFRYFPWGGLQANFLRIAKACLARGHCVEVYTLDWQGEQIEGLKLNILEVPGRQNITRYTHFAARAERLTREQGYDLVLGFNRMPGLDLYYAADPCFVERIRKTRPWYYPLTARYRHFQGVEERLFGPQSNTQIFALSQLQIDEYSHHYSTSGSRFSLLPPAVQQHYRRDENGPQLRQAFRQQYGITEHQWVLLMIGSGYERKGMDRGLRAVAALPTEVRDLCQIFVLGKGREKSLHRLAKRLGLGSQLTIVPGTDEVPLYLQGADLLIHAARSENTGNVIVEAIAAGLPVLCSGTCGYAGHVERAKAGLVIDEPFDQAVMNRQFASMLEAQELLEWQERALEYAAREDLYSRTEQVVEEIETLAAKLQKNA
jgi:UDP-glucose:(heptosyl)LPS alpha-1,3-glucosyltransferase